MIESLKNKFEQYGYWLIEEQNILTFSKNDILFKFIKQRFNELEVYFSNSSKKNLKLDFTLEIFVGELNLDEVINDHLGEKTESEILKYYDKLIFDIGLFLVSNQKDEIDVFINWYERMSNEVYDSYLKTILGNNKR